MTDSIAETPADQPISPPRLLTHSDAVVAFILIALVAVIFAPVTSHEFIGYDDPFYVTENPFVMRGLTVDGIRWAFRHGADAAYWTPITFLSHMLDVQLFGMHPGAHHGTSVALHALNSVLLYLVLLALTRQRWPSAVVSALFAVHPLRVESVAWIAERKDLISGLFLLLCIAAHIAWSRRGRWPRYLIVMVLYVLGLMSKPMLVTTPLLLLILDFWPLRRHMQEPKRSLRWLLLEKAPMVAIAILFSAMTIIAQEQAGAMRSLEQVPLSFRVTNAIVSYARYLGKTFWPVNLAVFYPPPSGWPAGILALSAAVLIAITIVAVRIARSRPYVPAGWFWFVTALVPVIGFVQVGRQAMADRYTYIPHIGLFIAIVWTAWSFTATERARWTFGVISAVLILAAATRSADQVKHWRNTQMLFEHALSVTQDNAVAMAQVGNARVRAGRLAEGEALYRRALELQPEYGMAHLNLANLMIRRRDFASAANHYQAALRWRNDLPRAHMGLALAYSGLKRFEEADQSFAEALRRSPRLADAELAWGLSLKQRGLLNEANNHFRAALAINPDLSAAERELTYTRSTTTSAPAR